MLYVINIVESEMRAKKRLISNLKGIRKGQSPKI